MRARIKRTAGALFTLKAPLEATAYRGKIRPFEATRYLNVRALKAARRKVTIEIGTIEAGGKSFPVAAEIRRGQIVALRPLACVGCHDGKPKSHRLNAAALKQTMLAVEKELERRNIAGPRLPAPLRISAERAFSIPLGPIVITIGDLGSDGWDACITIYIPGFNICWCCIFNGCRCYDIP